jgi:hypothetical protein
MKTKASIMCAICERTIETDDLRLSPFQLAERNGWGSVTIHEEIDVFVCHECTLKLCESIKIS